jgi:hypothetical protein
MRPEYRFDYRKARPNRFARLLKGRTVAVVLDPDVASVFQSSESVNVLLSSVISALPRRVKVQQTRGSLDDTAGDAAAGDARPSPQSGHNTGGS